MRPRLPYWSGPISGWGFAPLSTPCSLLLIADAGFGKTTALQDALSDGTDAAWVRCRDAGGDAGRLLGLVVEAIRGALPGAVDVLAERARLEDLDGLPARIWEWEDEEQQPPRTDAGSRGDEPR